MRKTFTSLMALVVTMVFATSAMAQKTFTGSVDCYSTAGYNQKYITFSLTEIAEELDTDTATLVAALNEQVEHIVDYEVQDIDPIFFNITDGNASSYYTQGGVGGFWMDKDAAPVTWGENTGAKWFNTLSWSAEDDALYIGLGQFPDANEPGDKFSATYLLQYNNQSVKFNVTLNVTEKPAVDVTPILSKLNILDTKEVKVEQYVRTGFDADNVTLYLGGAATKLGLDPATVATDLSDYIYCTNYDATNEVVKDSLTNASTANGIGWWLTSVYDENTGNETDECAAVAYGTNNVFFVQNFAYNADTLSFQLGQNPSTMKVGSNKYVYLYLISGTNAVRIKVCLSILEKPKSDVTFDKMTKVGSEEVAFVRDPSLGYGASTYYFDADSIAALFGDDVSASDLTLQALDTNSKLTDGYTANGANGGFWMDLESHPVAWGSGTKIYFAEYTYSAADSYFNIGNMDNQDFDGGTVTAGSLYLTLDDKYYEFVMRVQMGEKEDSTVITYPVADCKTVATFQYEYQIVPNSEYQDYTKMDTTIFLDMTQVESLLGTGSPTFYAETYADSTGNIFSKTYTCSPNPGFWMDPDTLNEHHSVASGWGSANTYGICFTDDYFQFYQYPNSTSAMVGNYYTDNFYLVNTKSGKKIQYTITVKYVEELTKHDNVGQESVAGKSRGEDGYGAVADIDLTAMYTAFGCTAEEFAEAGTWVAPNAAGTYAEDNYDAQEGFFFGADGKTVDDGTEIIHAGINEEGKLATYVLDDANVDNEYTVTFAALYNDQMYYFYCTINAAGLPAGISGITDSTVKSGVVYDLTGRKLITPTKGVYILDGKKYLLK